MPNWEILEVCRDTTITDPPPLFRVVLKDLDNHSEGVTPTKHLGPEAALRAILIKLGITDAAINTAFTSPPNCL